MHTYTPPTYIHTSNLTQMHKWKQYFLSYYFSLRIPFPAAFLSNLHKLFFFLTWSIISLLTASSQTWESIAGVIWWKGWGLQMTIKEHHFEMDMVCREHPFLLQRSRYLPTRKSYTHELRGSIRLMSSTSKFSRFRFHWKEKRVCLPSDYSCISS